MAYKKFDLYKDVDKEIPPITIVDPMPPGEQMEPRYSPSPYTPGTNPTADAYNGITLNKSGDAISSAGNNLTATGMPVNDWGNDTSDYLALAMQSNSGDEFNTWMTKLGMQREAQGGNAVSGDEYSNYYNLWSQTKGDSIPGKFKGSDGQDGVGYYGKDENGRWGYYADEARTVKLPNGWNIGTGNNGRIDNTANTTNIMDISPTTPTTYTPSSDVVSAYFPSAQLPQADTTWKEIADRLSQNYINMDYGDWTQGDAYKALSDRYQKNGQQAMQNVLGQIAARTGGLGSSYATTAAQQQYNEYMALLEQAARQSFDADRQQAYDNAQLALSNYGRDYNEFLNALNQYNNDRSFDYNAYRDSVGDQRYNDEFAYQQFRDLIGDARYADETAYTREQNALKQQQQAEEAAAGYTPTFSQAQVLSEAERARKNGYQLSGNLLRDYNYYMYGDPDYTGAMPTYNTTPTGNNTQKTGKGYDNGNHTPEEIERMQDFFGDVAVDGKWGPNSQKKHGSVDKAWEEYQTAINSGKASPTKPDGISGQEWAYRLQQGQSDYDKKLAQIEAAAERGTSLAGIVDLIERLAKDEDEKNRLAASFGY